MENAIQIFEGNEVRTAMHEDGTIWFCLKDVCDVLEIGNPSQAATRLDDDERCLILTETAFGAKEINFINESGLYSLIGGSRSQKCKPFKRWVNHEVLPTIRKTGSYGVQHQIPQTYEDALIAAGEAMKLQKELRLALEEQQPFVNHSKSILSSESLIQTTTLAKEFGFTSAKALNNKLHEMGIQYKDPHSGVWRLYAKYTGMNLTGLRTDKTTTRWGNVLTHHTMAWTETGREFLRNLFDKG